MWSVCRYYLIQRAKEAGTVGILVGTLGAADYLDMIEHLKRVIKSAGKKVCTLCGMSLLIVRICAVCGC